MEKVIVEVSPEKFDAAVHGKNSLPSGCDFVMYIKPVATKAGNPCACIAFTVQLPDGSVALAQNVITLKCFDMLADVVAAHRMSGTLPKRTDGGIYAAFLSPEQAKAFIEQQAAQGQVRPQEFDPSRN